jgi:hypothetical protein
MTNQLEFFPVDSNPRIWRFNWMVRIAQVRNDAADSNLRGDLNSDYPDFRSGPNHAI